MKSIFMYCLVVATFIFGQQNHVFWYKCITNNYLINDSLGPDLPSNCIRHEGKILSSAFRQSEANITSKFIIGNYNSAGYCAVIWSKDLMNFSGAVSNAFLQFELTQPSLSSGAVTAGPIFVRVGVVDFSKSIQEVWHSPDSVSDTAIWLDNSNQIGWSMNFDADTNFLAAETLITLYSPSLSTFNCTESCPDSTLKSRFFRIPILTQVNWILMHTGIDRGRYHGQYGIVFLVDKQHIATGRVYSIADEACKTQIYDTFSWSKDGNTIHLFVQGDLSEITSIESSGTNQLSTPDLFSVSPNPSQGQVMIRFNKSAQQKRIKIFDLKGRCIRDFGTISEKNIVWKTNVFGNGFYFLVMEIAGKKYKHSILVMR